MAQSFTRLELRDAVTASADLTAQAYTFTLTSDTDQITYFAMRGVIYETGSKEIFNSASITNVSSNATFGSSSVVAGFSIEPNATATFTFTPTATINASDISFIAANPIVYSVTDPTASGSASGVTLDITP